MNLKDRKKALASAVEAASEAGALMRKNWRSTKRINSEQQYDIKLELDVRCQGLIEARLRKEFPGLAVLGEEGITGDEHSEYRWVVDPIDGTVNFAYQIPHACVSIALQKRVAATSPRRGGKPIEDYETIIGTVFDPFCDELWTAVRGGRARLNGVPISVSKRSKLNEAIVSVGFAKYQTTLEAMLPVFGQIVRRVRKVRIMGAAALAMVYVASGRFDGYVENGVRLWDIAAGGLILECAGGEFWRENLGAEHRYRVLANNGLLRKKLQAF